MSNPPNITPPPRGRHFKRPNITPGGVTYGGLCLLYLLSAIPTHARLAGPGPSPGHNAVDGQRRLRDVGGDDDLAAPRGRPLEDLRLLVGGQRRVDRQDDQLGNFGAEAPRPLFQGPGRSSRKPSFLHIGHIGCVLDS